MPLSDTIILFSGMSLISLWVVLISTSKFERSLLLMPMIEAELFGVERNLTLGIEDRVEGKFERAYGGTLFLDEIGDMPMEAQTRLLRVLQEGEFTRAGGMQPVKVDVRIIAATHQDLRALINEGRFREDLYHRLDVITLELPPLSERGEDVLLLAESFLKPTCLLPQH